MTRTSVKNAMALVLIATVLLLSGCDLINDLIGNDDDLNENQQLLETLFGNLRTADDEVAAYAMAHTGAFPTGFTVNDVGNVRTRTYTNYTNENGVLITGTDVITFNGTPGPMSGITAGDMDMNFDSIDGGPYLLTLNMTATTPPPTYTACTVNGDDFLADYLSMAPEDNGPPGPPPA